MYFTFLTCEDFENSYEFFLSCLMSKQRSELKPYPGPVIRLPTRLPHTHSRPASDRPRGHWESEPSLIIVDWVRSPKSQNEEFIKEEEDQQPLSGTGNPSLGSFPNRNNCRQRKTLPCLVLGAARKTLGMARAAGHPLWLMEPSPHPSIMRCDHWHYGFRHGGHILRGTAFLVTSTTSDVKCSDF